MFSTSGLHTAHRNSERPGALSGSRHNIPITPFRDIGSAKRKANADTSSGKKARLSHDPFIETDLTAYAPSRDSRDIGTAVLPKQNPDNLSVPFSHSPFRNENRQPTSNVHSEPDRKNHYAFISKDHVPVSKEGLKGLKTLLEGVNYVRARGKHNGDCPGYYIEFKPNFQRCQEGIQWTKKMNKPDGPLLLEKRFEVQFFRNNGILMNVGS